jgi:hypothetical protein
VPAERWRVDKLLFLVVIVTAASTIFTLVVIALLVHGREFERVAGYNLQVRAALLTLDDLALLDVIDVDNERIIALGANDRHTTLLLG